MITRPVLVVGAPRSGTSLLQRIIRDLPDFWSMPSESDIVWDRHCHPRLRDWDSERLDAGDLTPEARRDILWRLERLSLPARFWRTVELVDVIWTFRRSGRLRPLLGKAYDRLFPHLNLPSLLGGAKRLVEKTASNCFRLGYVGAVFPDARFVVPVRDGLNNVNSLINGWRHPKRFFTYDVPADLRIGGYPHRGWKFVLPPGWRAYTDRPLEEVCAFQWRACLEAVLAELGKPAYRNRVLRIRLEELAADPATQLRRLARFLEVPYDDAFGRLEAALPVVNSPDGETDPGKWKRQNADEVRRIVPAIAPLMERLGYSGFLSSQI
jgi:hypothetical protein